MIYCANIYCHRNSVFDNLQNIDESHYNKDIWAFAYKEDERALNLMTNNLHTCDSDKLALLLVKLNLYKKEAENLDIDFVISGYSIDDWITDIKNKFDITKTKAEIYNLKTMESKLDELLSEDKKTELEIDDIAALLD